MIPVNYGRARTADQARSALPAEPADRSEMLAGATFSEPSIQGTQARPWDVVPRRPLGAGQERPLVGTNLVRTLTRLTGRRF